MDQQLAIIRGLPGQGKSTFARNYFPSTFHCENDMYHQLGWKYDFKEENAKAGSSWCWRMVKEALDVGCDAVVSNVFVSKKSIERYTKLAEALGVHVTVYRMATNYKNIHDVPAKVYGYMKAGFEDWPGEIYVSTDADGNYIFKDKAE